MTTPAIDFRRIRPHRGSQNTGFEELTRQLVLAAPPSGYTGIEHRGAGADGGVEILVNFADGTCWGWQSKYFIDQFGAPQISQLKESFKSALKSFPSLTKYIVALPQNLSGSGVGPNSDARDRWNTFKQWAGKKAKEAHRTVEIDLWDETELIRQLALPTGLYPGARMYWFDQIALTAEWFRTRFETIQADLGERYSPDDHVDVEIQQKLDVLVRNAIFESHVREFEKRLDAAVNGLEAVFADKRYGDEIQQLALKIVARVRVQRDWVLAQNWKEQPRIDHAAYIAEGRQIYKDARPLLHWTAGTDLEKNLGDSLAYAMRKVDGLLENTIRSPWEIDHDLLRRPVLLLVGEAGQGKSHALAHATDLHLKDGGAAVMLLGQYFGSGDPWLQMASKLDLAHRSQEEILGSLQAAALASGRPCVIAIDAINEADDPSIWRNHLSGLVTAIERFDRLAFVVSCRTTYEAYCLPPSHGLARYEHRGFEGNAAKAAKEYLDKRGIDRPATPFLSPEFTNPLFLSTACKALEARGEKAFPLGLDGFSALFRFYVDSVQENLIRRGFDRFDPSRPVVWDALQAFAVELALSGVASLPRDKAKDLLEKHLYQPPTGEHRRTFLFRLEDEGLLRRLPRGPSAEEVTFTFQRFLDHFVAAAVLKLTDTPSALATAMKKGGDFAYLTDGKVGWQHAGVIEALMVQVPEKYGIELALLEPNFTKEVNLPVKGFTESLKFRSPKTAGADAVALFERLAKTNRVDEQSTFTTLLELCSQPSHALNADYLHRRLSQMSMAERDASWSSFLFHGLGDEGAVSVLIDWAASVDAARAEPERLRLVAIALGWMLTTPDRRVRDAATKSLSTLFVRAPTLIANTIRTFAGVNDPYARERIFAAAYGALLHVRDRPDVLRAAALETYASVFNRKIVESHAALRDFARGIIEIAASRGVLPSEIELKKCRPPYASREITRWPSLKEVERLKEQRGAGDIVNSAVGWISSGTATMAGDFGQYIMSALGRSFSKERRSKSAPLKTSDEKAAFWHEVASLGKEVGVLAKSAQSAHAKLRTAESKRSFAVFSAIKQGKAEESDEDIAPLKEKFSAAEAALLKNLLVPLRKQYAAFWTTPYRHHLDDQIPLFPIGQARCWVATRAFELGWAKEKHEEIERHRGGGYGRHDHAVERIGKKYQWIAYWELVGYLADYHWQLDWNHQPSLFDRVDPFDAHDIDPSFLLKEGEEKVDQRVPNLELPPTDFEGSTLDADLAWTKTTDDLPHVPSFIERTDSFGRRWWMVKAFRQDDRYMQKLQSTGTMRTGQAWINFVIMREGDVSKFFDKVRDRTFLGSRLFDEDEVPQRLVGENAADVLPAKTNRRLLDSKADSVAFASLATGLSPRRGEFDHSAAVESFSGPSEFLLRALKLRPESPWSPAFVSPDGQIAFLDTRLTAGDRGAVLVNADLLSQYLDEKGLVPVWIMGGEKDGGLGRGEHHNWNQQTERRRFSGFWWLRGRRWHGGNWPEPEEKYGS